MMGEQMVVTSNKKLKIDLLLREAYYFIPSTYKYSMMPTRN